jgi:prepilin-type N-terminal cleavage/methylation domain-containing protein
MKPRPAHLRRPQAGFSLIELIGVLAIMAILASVIGPNTLRSLDRAAIRAEAQTLENLGEQVKLYLRSAGTAPTPTNWTTSVASYADISPADIATNRRRMNRVYLTDPASTPTQRVLILSSMRAGLNLPSAANINTAVRFQDIWQTVDGALPTAISWSGWLAWNAVGNSADYLLIERVNLSPVYNTDLQSLALTLNNKGAAVASYNLVLANGTVQAAVNVPAGGTAILSNQHPRDRINLYRAAGGVTLDYSYVLSKTGRTFDFNGTAWIPQ